MMVIFKNLLRNFGRTIVIGVGMLLIDYASVCSAQMSKLLGTMSHLSDNQYFTLANRPLLYDLHCHFLKARITREGKGNKAKSIEKFILEIYMHMKLWES